MKKAPIWVVILLFFLCLTACSKDKEAQTTKESTDIKEEISAQTNIDENPEEKQNTNNFRNLILTEESQYSFGKISVNAFKRDDSTLYYSWTVKPTTSNRVILLFKNFYTIVGDQKIETSNQNAVMTLDGSEKSDLMIVTDIDPKTVSGIGFVFDNIETQWQFGTFLNEGGDQSYINEQIAKMQNQTNTTQTVQTTTAPVQTPAPVSEEESLNTSGYAAIESFANEIYPDGFYVDHTKGEISRTKLEDGHWLVKAYCLVRDTDGILVSDSFEAEIMGYPGQWEVTSLTLYDE